MYQIFMVNFPTNIVPQLLMLETEPFIHSIVSGLFILVLTTGLEIKKKKKKRTKVAFWRLTEKDKSPISKFELPEVIRAPKAGEQVQNFPLTLTARQFTQK